MIPPEYIELMNREIDGANSAEDAQRLQAFLAENPPARVHFRELRDAVGIFDQVALVDPPVRLRQRILTAVDALDDAQRAAKPVAESRSAGEFLRNLWRRPRQRLAFATGVAFGLLLTAAAWQLTTKVGSIRNDDLSGAILREAESGRGARGESLTIGLAGVDGNVRTYYAHGRTLIRIGMNSEGRLRIRLTSLGGGFCERYQAASPGAAEVRLVGNRIELVHSGQNEYDVVINHAEARIPEIQLQIQAEEAVVFEETIRPPDLRN